jgi:hypothetical protein
LLFDNSTGHRKMPADALLAHGLLKGPASRQLMWGGKTARRAASSFCFRSRLTSKSKKRYPGARVVARPLLHFPPQVPPRA